MVWVTILTPAPFPLKAVPLGQTLFSFSCPCPLPQSTTGLWQSVEFHGTLHGHISAQVGELHFNQLPRV